MKKREYGIHFCQNALALVVSVSFILCAESHGGPLPPPMEVDLDQAGQVVVGQITSIKAPPFDPAGGLQWGTAIISVKRTLKGSATNEIETNVVVGEGSRYGGSWAPNIRHVGDSGIWILGNPSDYFGLVPESKLQEVEQALDSLARSAWTARTNGLEARTGIFYPQYEGNPAPWLTFVIRNVSDHEIYYPLDGVTGTLVVVDSGQTLSLQHREDDRRPVFCDRLAAGASAYVLNYFLRYYFKDAPPGKCRVTLTYENLRDGETSGGFQQPHNRAVEAWKGVLTTLPFEVPLASPTKVRPAQPISAGDSSTHPNAGLGTPEKFDWAKGD